MIGSARYVGGMGGGSKSGRGAPLVSLLLGLTLVAASCQTASRRADLFYNGKLRQRTGYQAAPGVDRIAYLAPVRDGRSDIVPAAAGSHAYYAFVEGRWERPMDAMIYDVIREEIEESGVFAQVTDELTPDALIVQPVLMQCTCGSIEKLTGGYQSLAEVSIRLAVYGPDTGDGARTVIHDQIYTDRQASEPRLSPPESPMLLAMALRAATGRMLVGLDKSNVARSSLEGLPQLPDLPELPELPDLPATPTKGDG